MLIEAVKPLKVKLQTGEVHLTPGIPVRFPTIQARKLLERAQGKVRVIDIPKSDWLKAWRDLAELTYGVTREDTRFGSIMEALNVCDVAYLSGDWTSFQESEMKIRSILQQRMP